MRIGIHPARLFPELEHQALHVLEQAVDRHWALQNRERNKPRIQGRHGVHAILGIRFRHSSGKALYPPHSDARVT
jgi:hypothetical protein